MRQVSRCVVTALIALLLATPLLAQRPPASPDAGTPAPAAALVNLNTATVAQLESLPGIGPKTAVRIIDHRQKNGAFKKIEELMNVRGIGEKSFLKLKPLITVAPVKTETTDQAGQR